MEVLVKVITLVAQDGAKNGWSHPDFSHLDKVTICDACGGRQQGPTEEPSESFADHHGSRVTFWICEHCDEVATETMGV